MDQLLLVSSLAIIQFLLAAWVKVRLEGSIKAEKDRLLEEYRYEVKTKEQAAKVAEYFSYYFRLQATSSAADYRRANQLGWELALWLPDDVYREVRKAVEHNNSEHNILSALIAVRKVLLSDPGSLTSEELFFHAPNARTNTEAVQTLPRL